MVLGLKSKRYVLLKNYISKLLHDCWNSPTIMTWGSFLSRSLTLILVTPLVVTRLTTEEISLWYIFSAIISLQVLADIGFTPTFSRVIAYAMGGAEVHNLGDYHSANIDAGYGSPNWKTVEEIYATMRAINSKLLIISTILLALLGSFSLIKPVSAIQNPFLGWVAWVVILCTASVSFRGTTYSAYLQGVNQIALLRRWEILTSFGSIICGFLALVLGLGLVGLVVSAQIWVVINVFRDRWLCITVEEGRLSAFTTSQLNPEVLSAVWPSAWRSSIGLIMNYGLMQASGIVYAQIDSTSGVASYLFAQRLLQTISQFSQAPFYSKLPLLARLRAEGNIKSQLDIAQKGMRLSYWAYAISFISIGLFANVLLKFIRSNIEFVNPLLWVLMGLGVFVERYGAMHIHLYSTTNHIIWHIANGVAGLIYLFTSLILFNFLGIYALPIAVLAAYLGFYSWYAAKHSYAAFGLNFFSFERSTILFPSIVILIYCGIVTIYCF